MSSDSPLVGILMGSDSDWPVLEKTYRTLERFGVAAEVRVLSAHRRPADTAEYARSARERGLKVVIAGAGGAAHLPGMIAALTTLPVIGVPVRSSNSIEGWDSILSILQMPSGVPVATVALNGAKNAGILAAQIIGSSDERVAGELRRFKEGLEEKVSRMVEAVKKEGFRS